MKTVTFGRDSLYNAIHRFNGLLTKEDPIIFANRSMYSVEVPVMTTGRDCLKDMIANWSVLRFILFCTFLKMKSLEVFDCF